MSDTDTASTNASEVPPPPAIRDPQFLRYLAGQTVSQLGNQVWFVALSWTAVHLGSAGTAGVLLTLSSLPRLVLMLFGGVLADRFDIRRLMIGSDILRTVITFAAAGIALASPGIPLLAVLAVTFGTVDAVFMPSAGAMQPRLLEPAQYAGAAISANMAARLALSLGGPLGGLLVAYGGVALALTVDAATFAVSVITLATVRPRPLAKRPDSAAHGSLRDDFQAGARFLVRHPVLRPLTLVTLVTNAGLVGPMNVGLAELSTHRGWGASGIGLLLTGFGIGSAIGALAMIRLRPRSNAGLWLTGFGVLQGAALFSTALAGSLPLAAIATGLAGLCSGPMAVVSSVLSQTNTPDEFRGRVSSVNTLIVFGLVPVASAGTGFAIAAFGVTGAYAVCGALEASSLVALCAPAFRRAAVKQRD